MLERNAEQSVEARVPAWFPVFIVFVVGLTLVFSLNQTPTYEATVKVLVSQKADDWWPLRPYDGVGLQEIALTVARGVRSESVARATIEQLKLPGLSAQEVLANTSVEPDPGTMFINVSYKDSDPQRAQLIANTIAEESAQKIEDVMLGNNRTVARIWQPATLPQTPVSPNPARNMLLSLAVGSVLGLAIWGTRVVTRSKNTKTVTPYVLEDAKEQELLEALGRSPSGELTAAGAALETSLTVEEAERILFRLAAKGHLRVRTREARGQIGGLFYSFWPTT
jgi:capsular polysaccharide biosynthesis protein